MKNRPYLVLGILLVAALGGLVWCDLPAIPMPLRGHTAHPGPLPIGWGEGNGMWGLATRGGARASLAPG
jgi:hypothetical protein